MLSQLIQNSWYRPFSVVSIVVIILMLPLSMLFCAISAIRKLLYHLGLFKRTKLSVPVIVVGNISVGGTGKTPLTIAVTEFLKSKGYRPGVISRGYGGKANHWPQIVTANVNPEDVGDEAVLIANSCQCPVSVGPNRVKAAEVLIQEHQCNIIVSDDGLQHLSLGRDIEIVVIDGERRFGNGLCLPAGPLRELPARLNSVDLIVANGQAKTREHEMALRYDAFEDIYDSAITKPVNDFSGIEVEAVSGIGNNERFFKALEGLDISINRHPFPDHYAYKVSDVKFTGNLPVLMTEKDAVKCRQFSLENAWFLKVKAQLNDKFYNKLESLLIDINKTMN